METVTQNRMILAIAALATSYGCQAEKGSVRGEPIGEAGASGVPAMATLEVRVLASEQPTWPSTVTVSVVLEDRAKSGVAGDKVAERSIRAEGAPPYSVTLTYAPSRLNPQGRYGVRAQIEEGDRLLFGSSYFTPAFGREGLPSEPPNEPIDLVVQRVVEKVEHAPASPGEAEPTVSGLLERRWKLRTLDGKASLTRGQARASFITLLEDGHEFRGNIGCVRLSGRYRLQDDGLRFPVIATSRPVRVARPGAVESKAVACTVNKKLRHGFPNALRRARRYELSGDRLTLFAEDGRALATFRAEM